MRISENKQQQQQSRLRHYIGAPKRFLRRARDFYVDSMVSFDGKVASANVVACPVAPHVAHLPKNFGEFNIISSTKQDDDRNLKELYESISMKCNWNTMEFDKATGLNEQRQRVSGYSQMDRSYSIALGKIGTIDEEEPCDFQENVVVRTDILFPRSKSQAVTRKNGFFP